MYLRGLGAYDHLPPAVKADAENCEARGGIPVIGYTAFDANRSPIPSSAYLRACQLPAASGGSGAQINVSVPTNVNTQVSPQISPSFVQQDKPQNSGVSTGASANPQQSNSGAEFMDYLQQMEQSRAASEARILDTLQRQAVSTPQADYLQPATEAPQSLPETVNKNIVPLAVAGAALLSIVAFFKSKKRG